MPGEHYFFQKTNVNKKGSMSSSAKQRTFSEKKGTIFSFLNQLFIAIDVFLSLCFINFRK